MCSWSCRECPSPITPPGNLQKQSYCLVFWGTFFLYFYSVCMPKCYLLLSCMLSNSMKMIFYCVPATWIFINWELLYIFFFSAVLRNTRVSVSVVLTEEIELTAMIRFFFFFCQLQAAIQNGLKFLSSETRSLCSLCYGTVEAHQRREDETGLYGHLVTRQPNISLYLESQPPSGFCRLQSFWWNEDSYGWFRPPPPRHILPCQHLCPSPSRSSWDWK